VLEIHNRYPRDYFAGRRRRPEGRGHPLLMLCDQSSLKIIKRIDKKPVIFFAICGSLAVPRNRIVSPF
jgi:hypothetical protein